MNDLGYVKIIIILLSLIFATGTISVATDNFTNSPDLSKLGVIANNSQPSTNTATEPNSGVNINIKESSNSSSNLVGSEIDNNEGTSENNDKNHDEVNTEEKSSDIDEKTTSTESLITSPASNLTTPVTNTTTQPLSTLPTTTIPTSITTLPTQNTATDPNSSTPSPVLSLIQEYLQNPLNKFLEETSKNITESLASLFPTPVNITITEPRNNLTSTPNQNLVINQSTTTSPDFKITKQVIDSCKILINEYELQNKN